MIGYIEGNVLSSDGQELIVKISSGVGYQMNYSQVLKEGKFVQVFVTSIYREDGQTLFAFNSLEEKKFFELLLKVKGVGPKTAYNLMTHLGPDQISLAVKTENKSILNKVPGVGDKAAAQIILDLSGKIEDTLMPTKKLSKTNSPVDGEFSKNQIFQDTVMALKELGYKESEFNQIVIEKFKAQNYTRPENLLQDVLRSL